MSPEKANFSVDFENRNINLKEVDKKLREQQQETQADLNNLKQEVIETSLFKVLRSEKGLKVIEGDETKLPKINYFGRK